MKKPGNFSKAVEELMNGKIIDSDGESANDEKSAYGDDKESNREVEPKTEEAIITRDMVIQGSVSSSANIRVAGTIVGDVTSEGDVSVKGKIEGNVSAKSLTMESGSIKGDVVTQGTVAIADGAIVLGNIKADRIDVNGKVTGNLDSSGKVILNPRAVIEGNIATSTLSASDGAEIAGNVNVRKNAQNAIGEQKPEV